MSAKIDIYIDTRAFIWYNVTDYGDKCAHARARAYTREHIATDKCDVKLQIPKYKI